MICEFSSDKARIRKPLTFTLSREYNPRMMSCRASSRWVICKFLVVALVISLLQVVQVAPSQASTNVKLGVIGLQYSSTDDSLTKQQYLPRDHAMSLSLHGKSISSISSSGSVSCLVADGSTYCWRSTS